MVWTRTTVLAFGGLLAFLAFAPLLADPFTLAESSFDRTGITLRSPAFEDYTVYTIQAQDSLSPGGWAPAPASVWPINSLFWKDPRLPQSKAQFYRAVVYPSTPAVRGQIVSATSLGAMSPADIQAAFAQIGVPLLRATNGVNLYKLVYQTINPFELSTVASGLLVLPQNATNALPLVSYQHGTIIVKDQVPSSMLALERVVGLALGTSDYAACLPDYLGLGDSPGLHPFVHAKSEATAAIDMLRASRAFCASNSVVLNGQLFLLGYSEGGHATLALHKEIETYYTNEFTITASAPEAGPYDLGGVEVNDFLSGRVMPDPYYFLYLIAAYQSIYQFAGSLAEILAAPYDATLPSLLDGQHDGSVINQAMGNLSPTNVFKPEFLQAFRDNPNHPLRQALQDNSLIDWTPKAPMQLCQCDGDHEVLYANSQVAYDSFIQRGATQVLPIEDPAPGADHGPCAPLALLYAKLWFDTFRK
jgi:hypothetical protein